MRALHGLQVELHRTLHIDLPEAPQLKAVLAAAQVCLKCRYSTILYCVYTYTYTQYPVHIDLSMAPQLKGVLAAAQVCSKCRYSTMLHSTVKGITVEVSGLRSMSCPELNAVMASVQVCSKCRHYSEYCYPRYH